MFDGAPSVLQRLEAAAAGMTLKYPGEPTLTGLINGNERDDLRSALLRLGPKLVFSGFLWHAQQSGEAR